MKLFFEMLRVPSIKIQLKRPPTKKFSRMTQCTCKAQLHCDTGACEFWKYSESFASFFWRSQNENKKVVIRFKMSHFDSNAFSFETKSTNSVVEETSVFHGVNRCTGKWNALASLNFNFAQTKYFVLERRGFICWSAEKLVSDHTRSQSSNGLGGENIHFSKTILSSLID